MSFIDYSKLKYLFTNGIRIITKDPKCEIHNFKLVEGICLECERERKSKAFFCKECNTKHAPLFPFYADEKKIIVDHYLCTDCKEEQELCQENCQLSFRKGK